MKRKATLFFLFAFPLSLFAQVTIVSTPRKGFEKRIRGFIDTMTVVDTHEHLMNPAGIPKSGMCDFMLLFHHYADDDIKSAGMPKPVFETLLKDSMSTLQKWEIMKPHWENSFNTGYNRVVSLTVDKLFGIKKIDGSTVNAISEKIREAYQGDWFHTVLKNRCNFDFVIVDGNDRSFGDPAVFRYVKRFDYFQLDSRKKIDQASERAGFKILSLDGLVNALNHEFENALTQEFVAVKNGTAYFRSQYFEDVSKEKAEVVFNMILNSPGKVFPFETIKPLSDFMMHRLLDLALKHDKPVQIHTGLQAGDGNTIENSNPALLANLFLKYRDVKFVLFHGGYPYGGELASLAKNFRNVYIDLCWLYIISPSYSERYLHEWLETIPANKIMAFGGDYHNVENVYGHLLFAKEVIGNVLIDKVQMKYFSEEEALKIAKMMLHDNAVNLFQLKH